MTQQIPSAQEMPLSRPPAAQIQIPGLESYTLEGALWAGLGQSLLQECVINQLGEDFSWKVDFTQHQLSYLGQGGRKFTCQADLIASFAPGPRSMMWAWNMGVNNGEAERLREYGQRFQIDWLCQPEVSFQSDGQGDLLYSQIRNLAHHVAWAIEGISGRLPYYTVPNNNGGALLMLLDVPELKTPRIDEAFPGRLMHATLPLNGSDQRGSVHRLAELAGWTIEWLDANSVQLGDLYNATQATVNFAGLGQITNINLAAFSK